eukprot:1136526-Pelagomonas_calceolata.AAC.8
MCDNKADHPSLNVNSMEGRSSWERSRGMLTADIIPTHCIASSTMQLDDLNVAHGQQRTQEGLVSWLYRLLKRKGLHSCTFLRGQLIGNKRLPLPAAVPIGAPAQSALSPGEGTHRRLVLAWRGQGQPSPQYTVFFNTFINVVQVGMDETGYRKKKASSQNG